MRYPSETTDRIAVPRRRAIQTWGFFVLLLVAVGFLVLGKTGTGVMERVRTGLGDVLEPVMETLAQPIRVFSRGVQGVEGFFDVYSKNQGLREANRRLEEWQGRALALAAENESLRRLTNFRPATPGGAVSLRVVSDSTGVFVQSVLAGVGSDAGLSKGDAVVDTSGLVGRVIETGRRSARILLVTDINSKIPVVVQRTRVPAILAGNNGSTLTLEFLPDGAEVEPGDRVVTSGHGDVFPPDIQVGEVVAKREGGPLVRPSADLRRLDYVRVLTVPRADLGAGPPAEDAQPAKGAQKE